MDQITGNQAYQLKLHEIGTNVSAMFLDLKREINAKLTGGSLEKNVQNLTAKDIGGTIGTGPQREGRALNFSLSVFFFFFPLRELNSVQKGLKSRIVFS